jgi:hypothetical protein
LCVPRSIWRTCPRQPAGGCSPRVPFARARRCPTPHGERPCDGYGLQGVSWEIGIACVKLAPLQVRMTLLASATAVGQLKPWRNMLPIRVNSAAWWPQTLAWMSRISSRSWGMGMHRCRTPDAARLYNSLSITVNDLDFLAMRLAWVRSEGSSPRSIQARYLARQSSVRGGGLCFHGLAFVHAIPFE